MKHLKPSSKKIRLLIIIPSLRGGGSERVITTLVKYLSRDKFSITLVVLDKRGGVYFDDLPNDISVLGLYYKRVRYALFRIIQIIIKERPDIILSTLNHLNLMMGFLKIFIPFRIRFIARSSTIQSSVVKNKFKIYAYRMIYQKFDQIICQSHYMKQDLVENFKITKTKLAVIYNPVDVDRIRLLTDNHNACRSNEFTYFLHLNKIKILSIGRLSHEKGYDLLIPALYHSGRKDINLFILGEGPLYDDLQKLVNFYQLNEQVFFVGFQMNPYMWLSHADALVLTSRFEGLPNVVLEALACQTPVITTPAVGGVTEIVKDVPGCILTKDISMESISDALRSFTPGMRLSDEHIKKFTVQNIIPQYERLFLSLV